MFRLPGSESEEVKDESGRGPGPSRLLARPGRLPALLIALAVIPAALIALFAWTQTSRLVERGVGEDLSSTASSLAIYTESILENVTKEAKSMVTEPSVRNMEPAAATRAITQEIAAFSPTYRQAILADTGGRVIAAATRPPDVRDPILPSQFRGVSVKEESWFQALIVDGQGGQEGTLLETVKGRPILGRIEGSDTAPPAPVAAVEVKRGNETVGVLAVFPNWPVIAIGLANGVEEQARRIDKAGVRGLLIDRQGRVLAGPDGTVDLETDFSKDPIVEEAFSSDRSGWAEYYDDPNDGGWLAGDVISGFDTLRKGIGNSDFEWAYLVSQEKTDALANTGGLKRSLILIAIAVALAAGLIALFVGRALIRRAQSLRATADEVASGASMMKQSAAQGRTRAQRTEELASDQVEGLQGMRERVEEMRETGRQIGESARVVAEQAGRAAAAGEDGRKAAEEVDQAMAGIEQRVRTLSDEIAALTTQTDQIGEIVSTVSGIADQSNLLAFNATIEAAKAGEQGAGFTVVADEVRTLAERSKRATAQIRAILGEVDKATGNAERSAREGLEAVTAGRERAASAARTIDELAEANREAERTTREIASLAPNQLEASERVISAAEDSVGKAVDVRTEAHQSSTSTAELDRLAERLNELASTLGTG
jgi:methyl-accepting chemotaxis protein